MAAPKPRSEIVALVYAAIRDAARDGAETPTVRQLRKMAGCQGMAVSAALKFLESAGRIAKQGCDARRSYFVAEIGKATEPGQVRRPGARPGTWNLSRDGKLTATQRSTLSLARLLIARDGFARVSDIARQAGVNDGAMSGRLVRIAERGHLRQLDDMTYVLATPAEQAARAVPAARVEIRDGLKITICPPRLAPGALIFRSGLGLGGVALAGGGQQRVARRA